MTYERLAPYQFHLETKNARLGQPEVRHVRMMRRLGRRWQQLHRLVYPVALMGVIHFLWLVKKDLTEPLIYVTVLVVLLTIRLP
jgi:hypothetical protein